MRFQLPKGGHYRTRGRADQRVKQRIEKEATMNKIIIALMAIYFLGDPQLQYLSWLGDLKIYAVAAALSLVSMPWIASQLDG
jgi:hypothetical protein